MSRHNYSQYSSKKKDSRKTGLDANAASVGGKTGLDASAASVDGKTRTVSVPASHTYTTTSNPGVITDVTVSYTPEVKMESEPAVLMGPIEVLPATVSGTVANCAKLNVRAEPSLDADVVCVLDVMSEIEIDINKSNKEWFWVCTATGVEGFCMRKFVDAYL